MRYFTSDTHFGDTRILRAAKRPFETIADHDAHLISRWRAIVRPDDEIWHLGDVALRWSADRLGALLDSLPGTKHLVTGNNDDAATRSHSAWAGVRDYAELDEGDHRCVLSHYAFRTWNGMGRGTLDLHGHSHAMLKPLTRQFDVGVDAWDYAPVTLDTMLTRRKRRAATNLV